MNYTKEDLDKIGPMGSEQRLRFIAQNGPEECSEAARRCLDKRARRLELIEKGLTPEEARLIVDRIISDLYSI